jgi:hypothetical protein
MRGSKSSVCPEALHHIWWFQVGYSHYQLRWILGTSRSIEHSNVVSLILILYSNYMIYTHQCNPLPANTQQLPACYSRVNRMPKKMPEDYFCASPVVSFERNTVRFYTTPAAPRRGGGFMS